MRIASALLLALCSSPVYETQALRTRVYAHEVCDASPRRVVGRREMSRAGMGVYTPRRPPARLLARDPARFA